MRIDLAPVAAVDEQVTSGRNSRWHAGTFPDWLRGHSLRVKLRGPMDKAGPAKVPKSTFSDDRERQCNLLDRASVAYWQRPHLLHSNAGLLYGGQVNVTSDSRQNQNLTM